MTALSRRFWAVTDRVPVPECEDTRTVNLDQAVAITGRCRRALYYWMKDGLLPYHTVHGRRWVRRDDLQIVRRYSERGRSRLWCQ